jgi:hypothetical protein
MGRSRQPITATERSRTATWSWCRAAKLYWAEKLIEVMREYTLPKNGVD